MIIIKMHANEVALMTLVSHKEIYKSILYKYLLDSLEVGRLATCGPVLGETTFAVTLNDYRASG